MSEDIVGRQTLELLQNAQNYLELSADEVGQYLEGQVLELGSGTGNLTTYLAFKHEITAIDINPTYLSDLAAKIQAKEVEKNTRALPFKTIQGDLTKGADSTLFNKYDTLMSFQVLEHLPDDAAVLKNYAACLKPGGKIVLQLPAMPMAFSDLDKNLGHYRRYTRNSVEKLLRDAGFDVVHSYYYNFIGLLGWIWAGKVLNKPTLPASELSFFNLFAKFFLKFDLLFSKFLGLNVIVVGKKSR